MLLQAYIFDMDDTLYKERTYRDSGYRTVAGHYAALCGMSPDDLYRRMAEDPSTAFENIEELAKRYSGKTVPVSEQLTVYRSHRPDITLDPEAVEVLEALRGKGVILGIITDGRARGQLNKIAALGLERYVDPRLIMPTVLDGMDKTSAEPYIAMEARVRDITGNAATRFTYVGDNPAKDFRHPNLRGWRTVMLRDVRGENIHRQRILAHAPEYRPQMVIDTLRSLLG